MPYVPSEKTVPPAEDRKILNPLVEAVAEKAASEVVVNRDLVPVYTRIFDNVGNALEMLIAEDWPTAMILDAPEDKLALAIYGLRKKYGYDGAEDGELNYSITRFIQRVPQMKVKGESWKDSDELRYWLYARTTQALTRAASHFEDSDTGIGGVYEDVKDEYKRRVNKPYETAQILKSGDCYDTPYYTRLVEVVDSKGKHIGHIEIDLKRSEETLHKDILDYQLVLKKKK